MSLFIGAPASARRRAVPLSTSGPWTPATLFLGGYSGMWLDFSDLSTMWQDTGKTTPVAADGDPVRVVTDKIAGLDWVSASDGLRPTYKTDGTLHWLEFASTKALANSSFSALSGVGEFTKGFGLDWSGLGGNTVVDAYPGSTHFIQINGYLRSYSAAGIAGVRTPHGLTTATKYSSIQVFDGSQAATHADRNKLYMNGSLVIWDGTAGTINATATVGSTCVIGAATSSGVAPFSGKMHQVVMVNKAISGAEQSSLDSFFGGKMGI